MLPNCVKYWDCCTKKKRICSKKTRSNFVLPQKKIVYKQKIHKIRLKKKNCSSKWLRMASLLLYMLNGWGGNPNVFCNWSPTTIWILQNAIHTVRAPSNIYVCVYVCVNIYKRIQFIYVRSKWKCLVWTFKRY